MPNAAKFLIASAFALAACQQKAAEENNVAAVEVNNVTGLPPGAEIETLPADESSTTPSGELNSGQDSPAGNEADSNGI
jgi:hypothetical protein